MTVEVLYVQGCPNLKPALQQLKCILSEEGVDSPIVELQVEDQRTAQTLNFPGSPTIRINGMDIEATLRRDAPAGLSCRTYLVEGRPVGTPGVDMIRAAVRKARNRREET
jgi:hypothetical protein